MQWPMARLVESARVAGDAFGEPLLGHLEPGAPADLAVLRYPAVTPVETGTLAAHWLFGLGAGAVRDVLVAGEPVVRDGRLTRLDQDLLAADSREAARRSWGRLEAIDVHPFESLEVPSWRT
jgi:cytosine/adenosine deaminase-related metal-dependent hydrolase